MAQLTDLELISTGETTTVSKGFDSNTQRHVAVKALKAEFHNNELIAESFWREANFLLGDHHNFVHAYDVDRSSHQIIMDLMKGDLSTYTKNAPMAADQVRQVLRQGLEGLNDLHEGGFLHGAVEPSNMLYNEQGRVKFCDTVGLRPDEAIPRPSGEGKYVAPEAVNPKLGDFGPHTDLYCLGLSVLELAAGPQFDSFFPGVKADWKADAAEAAWARWHGSAEYSLRPIRELVPQLDSQTARVLDKLLKKRLSDRYATATDALKDLDKRIEGPSLSGSTSGETGAFGIGDLNSLFTQSGIRVPVMPIQQAEAEKKKASPVAVAVASMLTLAGVGLVGAYLLRPKPVSDSTVQVQLATQPDGAEILINNQPVPMGQSQVPLAASEYQVRFRKENYQDLVAKLSVDPQNGVVVAGDLGDKLVADNTGEMPKLAAKLTRERLPIKVVSDPPGATVSVDGLTKELGDAVLVVDKLHRTKITLPLFGDVETVLRATADGKIELKDTRGAEVDDQSTPPQVVFRLNRVAQQVKFIIPEKSRLAIDGNFIDNPAIATTLPVGEHLIECTLDKFKPYRHKMKIESDGAIVFSEQSVGEVSASVPPSVALRLTPLPLTLRVASEPNGAMLKVNNKEKGQTPIDVEFEIGDQSLTFDLLGFQTLEIPLKVDVDMRQPQPFKLFPRESYESTSGVKFGLVSGGTFTRGSLPGNGDEDEHPQRRVDIRNPFYLGVTEVTQEQFEKVMGFNPSRKKLSPQHPVDSVNYSDAVGFCDRLAAIEKLPRGSYRLPTEAEWELAANDGGPQVFPTELLEQYAWFLKNSDGTSHPVATKKANQRGLFDMLGNVSEWCLDRYDPKYYASQNSTIDPEGPDQESGVGEDLRVLRGGDWLSGESSCRPAFRGRALSSSAQNHYGFRVVRVTISPEGARSLSPKQGQEAIAAPSATTDTPPPPTPNPPAGEAPAQP